MVLVLPRPKKELTFNLRMTAELKAKAAHVADSRYMSLAGFIDSLLREAVADYEAKHGPISLPAAPPKE
ncbi:hypothetical protein LJ737_20885 [Hymenobacter sp. 15J16-1T3B]|uniref:hypothetical protein n=1 Tax=Hymenobacter sp. 15J16-1T3B TaxID=2886941 RepID=UPI001D11C421|nr:hypothetical protein [Hymenobacter sp. 15J16-1T3B]MCC3159710.1 hypothetical protein [Hymenobacter sp. 15J16-1T3B]